MNCVKYGHDLVIFSSGNSFAAVGVVTQLRSPQAAVVGVRAVDNAALVSPTTL